MSMPLAITLTTIVLAAVCYLLGSVNFAIIYTRQFAHTDVRAHGSGNAGMTNVLRTAGKLPAVLTFVCDFLKGAVAVALGRFAAYYLLDLLTGHSTSHLIDPLYFAYLAGFFCLMGHIYPLFFSFKGGKGVASMAGIMLVIDWRVLLIALGMFILVMVLSRIVSLSSIFAALTLPISTFLLYHGGQYTFSLLGMPQRVVITLFSVFLTVLVVIKHIPNIKRLLKGEEKKIFSKKKS